MIGKVWRYRGKAGWHFLTLPVDAALAIRTVSDRRAFDSLAVRVRLGATMWSTSLFKDSRSSSYVLPIRGDVRRQEHVGEGDIVKVLSEPLGPKFTAQ